MCIRDSLQAFHQPARQLLLQFFIRKRRAHAVEIQMDQILPGQSQIPHRFVIFLIQRRIACLLYTSKKEIVSGFNQTEDDSEQSHLASD